MTHVASYVVFRSVDSLDAACSSESDHLTVTILEAILPATSKSLATGDIMLPSL